MLREQSVNLIDVWDPGEVLRMMREEGLGVGGGATYFLTSLLDHPDFTPEHLALMPFAGLGGSTVPVAVTQRATDLGIKVFRSYGSTEHPSITGCLLDDPEVKRLTTDGRALPGVEVRLDDDGQILSRGPDCFVGYIDPELTAQVFDEDGWYRTGDVGVLDDDGYLTITDRISDIIIRGGENISAAGDRGAAAGPGPGRRGLRGGRARRSPGRARRRRGPGARRHDGARPWRRCASTSAGAGWPARSGPRRSTWSTSSRGHRRARSRSSCSANGSARVVDQRGPRRSRVITSFSFRRSMISCRTARQEDNRMAHFPKPLREAGRSTTPSLGTGPVNYEDSISPEYYELERKAIFNRTWLNVGRVEQVPRVGRYFTKELSAPAPR